MGLFDKRTREERFWDWFVENSDRVFDFESNQDAVFRDLGRALGKVHRSLTFEFGPPETPREFTVSAEGIEEVFPFVERLVAAAPVLPHWRVLAFRQPGDPDATIQFAGQELGQSDIWFNAHQGSGKTGLTLAVRGLTEDNHELLAGAVFLLLDNMIGEYAVCTKVGEIDWTSAPDDPAAAGHSPLAELRRVFNVDSSVG